MPVKPAHQSNYDNARRFFVEKLGMPLYVAYSGNGEPKQPKWINGVLVDMADPRNVEMKKLADGLKKDQFDAKPRKKLFDYEVPGKQQNKVSTQALGEEDGGGIVSTQALGEEDSGHTVTTQAIGEEDGGHTVTTQAVGEEDGGLGRVSTAAIGEEDGGFRAWTRGR